MLVARQRHAILRTNPAKHQLGRVSRQPRSPPMNEARNRTLAGRVSWATGAAFGMERETVRPLTEVGATVAITDVPADTAGEIATGVAAAGASACATRGFGFVQSGHGWAEGKSP